MALKTYVYYTYQCPHCFMMSGVSGKTPEDAPSCCHGDSMVALRREVQVTTEEERWKP